MESADVGSDSTRLQLCLPLCQLDGPTQHMFSAEPQGPRLPCGESHVPLTGLLWPRNENQIRERRQSWGAGGLLAVSSFELEILAPFQSSLFSFGRSVPESQGQGSPPGLAPAALRRLFQLREEETRIPTPTPASLSPASSPQSKVGLTADKQVFLVCFPPLKASQGQRLRGGPAERRETPLAPHLHQSSFRPGLTRYFSRKTPRTTPACASPGRAESSRGQWSRNVSPTGEPGAGALLIGLCLPICEMGVWDSMTFGSTQGPGPSCSSQEPAAETDEAGRSPSSARPTLSPLPARVGFLRCGVPRWVPRFSVAAEEEGNPTSRGAAALGGPWASRSCGDSSVTRGRGPVPGTEGHRSLPRS